MPQAGYENGPNLAIRVDQTAAFLGGQTISGVVSRQSHLVDPDTIIIIQLVGRAKAKLHVRRGNSTSVYRSRYNFFGQDGLAFTIFRGPVHIPPDSKDAHRWPFAIPIPTTPDPNALQRERGGSPYISIAQAGSHPLPPSFVSRDVYRTERYGHCFVEYYLQATLQCQGSRHSRWVAVLPIQIRSVSTPTPITDFVLKPHHESLDVFTQRLDPEKRDVKLSTREKVKEIFHASTVPHYSFSVEFHIPSVLQIGGPYTVPFHLRAVPNWDRTSENIKDVPQGVFIRRFILKLKSTTNLTTWGLLQDESNSSVEKTVLASYERPKHDEAFNTPSPAPPSDSKSPSGKEKGAPAPASASDSKSPSGKEKAAPAPAPDSKSPSGKEKEKDVPPPAADILIVPTNPDGSPLDLGQALRIVPPKQVARQFPPCATFTTYNIAHSHELKWQLKLMIAGKEKSIEGTKPVRVWGHAYDQTIPR